MFQNEPISHFTPMMRSPMGGPTGSWSLDAGNNGEEIISSSLLDELKNNKTRHFELSEIVDHVAEFRCRFDVLLLYCIYVSLI